ncbi:NUDIX hydrolase [Kovacikia minuta CCNUW1]|uniref:NUDIX hydrolase n=1 Tax=Kovacikia minuta TaxID=2931930 RepID=UPI001CCF2D71|nr:NUDIX hydrolase [Kovacikia minuta]UBF27655.1 NUDIX hydrolase [Kovacikia minuta CCNUW1]
MILQSGVIPYRIKNGKVEVLLITSSSGKHWVIPKGWITPWLTPAASAEKEAWEEAGIKGKVSKLAIGSYEVQKWGFPCQVGVFPMTVETELANYPEAKRRKRQWMSLTRAIQHLREADLKLLLEHLDHSLTAKLK